LGNWTDVFKIVCFSTVVNHY